MIKKFALGILMLNLAAVVQASNSAGDNASTTNYPGGTWDTTTNGGFGFGSWSFATGNGSAGSYIGGTGDGSPAFGLFAAGGAFSNVTRPFTGGGLSPTQTFSLDLGSTANVATGAQIGLSLLSGANPKITFEFTGGQSVWQLNVGGSNFNTTIPFTANTKINFAFTYDGTFGSTSLYGVLITEGATTYTEGVTSFPELGIDGVELFDNGQGASENIGFNDFAIVPEFSGRVLFLAPALLGIVFLRRHRSA